MNFSIDDSALKGVKAMMSEIKNGYAKVVSGAINTTLTTVKTQATARIGNELNLKAARIKQDFTLDKANYTKLNGAVIAKGEPVGLVNFGATQTVKGVTVKVRKNGGRATLRHAYIAKGKGASISKADGSVKTHVWWRGKDRSTLPTPKRFAVGKRHRAPWQKFGTQYTQPVERLTGPRIEDFFAKPSIFDPVTIQANHIFAQNVSKKIDDILRRFG